MSRLRKASRTVGRGILDWLRGWGWYWLIILAVQVAAIAIMLAGNVGANAAGVAIFSIVTSFTLAQIAESDGYRKGRVAEKQGTNRLLSGMTTAAFRSGVAFGRRQATATEDKK